MNNEELIEHAKWLLTQKLSGAARDFVEGIAHSGFADAHSNSGEHQQLRNLMLFYPRN